MSNQRTFFESLLTIEDVKLIDQTGLSHLERHHLRLLAYCLACFKEMSDHSDFGDLPSQEVRLKWLLDLPELQGERDFANLLLEQFHGTGYYLEQLANEHEITPLQLKLEHLINKSLSREKLS